MKIPTTILIASGCLTSIGVGIAGLGVLFGGDATIVLPSFLQAIIG